MGNLLKSLSKKERLIYKLLFDNSDEYTIHISEYIVDIYKYDRFMDEVKEILEKGNVEVYKENVFLEVKDVRWKISTKK